MAIRFFAQDTNFRFRSKRAAAVWIEQVIGIEYHLAAGDIAVIFCSADYMLALNRRYLQHDFHTDVITFDYSQMPVVSGDIFIGVDAVRCNAKEYGAAFLEELKRVIIHGVLHLCGEKDSCAAEKKRMRQAENRCLMYEKSAG